MKRRGHAAAIEERDGRAHSEFRSQNSGFTIRETEKESEAPYGRAWGKKFGRGVIR
jgi:hypothetical protein